MRHDGATCDNDVRRWIVFNAGGRMPEWLLALCWQGNLRELLVWLSMASGLGFPLSWDGNPGSCKWLVGSLKCTCFELVADLG